MGLLRRILADKAKASLMLGLMAVMLLLWGRLMLKQVPRTAVAKPAAVAAVDKAAKPGAKAAWGYPVVHVDLPQGWTRDLFSIDDASYTRKPRADVDKSAKSDPKPSDEVVETTVVRKAAAGLALQTTMLGDRPRAMINGQLLEVGQSIEGFTIKSIGARSVVLEMRGIEIQLEM